MNFRNTIYCVLLSLLCTYTPTHGMMEIASSWFWGKQPLSQKEALFIKNQLTEYKNTIIKRLDDIKKLSENHKTQEKPNLQNNEFIIQTSLNNTIPHINNFISYIKLDPYITFSPKGKRLKILENIIEQITEKFSADKIENYKIDITNVHDTTQTMIKSLLENQSNKIQSPLEASTITFNKVQAENKKTRFMNSPNDLILYINAQKWEETIQTFILQLLWSNEFYQGGLNKHPDDLLVHHKNRQLYSTALNGSLPYFTEDSEGYKKLPTLILQFNDFEKAFKNVDCDATLKNFINWQLDTLIFIQKQNIQSKVKKIQQDKQNQTSIVNNLKKAINKKEKKKNSIIIKELKNYLKEMQKLLKLEESSSTETENKSKNNKITDLSEEIKITSEKIEKKIQLAQAKEATTKIQQQLKTQKNNKQASSINDLQAYIGALNKELSLLDSDEDQKEELTTRINNAAELMKAIEEKKLIKQQAMNQREYQKELVKNNPTKDNLVVYRNLLVIHLDSRLSEIKKQEIQQRLEDIDEQLKKIKILEGLQKELDSADTLSSLYDHAQSIIKSHMPQLIPSSFNNPFNKKIIENLTRCLQKINTINIEKNGEGFYELIKLNDALASLFETPNNNNNNNNISLNDDVILKFKGEYLALTQNLITSLLDEKLDDDKDTLESLQKNIAQVTGQEKPETITLEIKIGKEIEELQAKIKKNENEKETKEKEKKDLKIEIKKIEKESEQLKIEVQQTNIVVEIGKEETEKIDKEIKDLKIELDKRTQQNLEQEKIDKENMDALTALCERYNFKDLSPAQVIHYDPKTVENDLATLKDNTYILGLEKEYKKIVDGLTNIQKELQKASDTISSYKELFSERKYVFKDFNGICNNINILIQYLPTKKLTDKNNTLYQNLIETLLKYVDLIKHCSDLKSTTTIKRLEELIKKLNTYTNIDSENINKAIKAVNENIEHLKQIIQFYSQLTKNELLFHNSQTLRDDNDLQYQFNTKDGLLTLSHIADTIWHKQNSMQDHCKTLSSSLNSYQHLNQIEKIIKDLENLKDIKDLSIKIIKYKKNPLYQEIIKTINYCLTQINNDTMYPKLNEELISKLNSLTEKFETYAKFDQDNFNPMMQQLKDIIDKKPLNQPSQVSLIQKSSTAIVASQNNGQPILTLNNQKTNINNKKPNSNNQPKETTIQPSNTTETRQQQPAQWSLWTAVKSFFSWFAFWNWTWWS